MIHVYADCSNLYYTGLQKYGKKLDYRKAIEYIASLGEVAGKYAYGAQTGDEARGFITSLKSSNWVCNFKTPKTYNNPNGIKRKADWDVGIAVDMLTHLIAEGETVVLLSADGDMLPALKVLKSRKIRILVLGFNISIEMAKAVDEAIEIPPSMLEGAK